ncbi:hypothetical protein BT69DRAFT_1299534 [Atractiella rhizophila]|nr:hypothetical protein BT69DRAFT_1299534 [Atractiella rhizophila]
MNTAAESNHVTVGGKETSVVADGQAIYIQNMKVVEATILNRSRYGLDDVYASYGWNPRMSGKLLVLDMNGVEYFPSSRTHVAASIAIQHLSVPGRINVKHWFPTSNASLNYSDEVEGKPVSSKISTLKINNRFLLRFFLPQLFMHCACGSLAPSQARLSILLSSQYPLATIPPKCIVKSYGHYLPTLVAISTHQNGSLSKPGGRNSPASK